MRREESGVRGESSAQRARESEEARGNAALRKRTERRRAQAKVTSKGGPGWHLAQLKIDRNAAEAAVARVHDAERRYAAGCSKTPGRFPEEIFRQMRTCKTAAERVPAPILVRDLLPRWRDDTGQTTAKATRMARYLTKTPEKVAAIVRAAEMARVNRTQVQTVECTPLLIPGRTDRNGNRICDRCWMQRRESGKREKEAPGARRA
ncbi:hypothetical protein EDB85DRAFT_2280057 [Lactarius pseudohatsudake]|nr:hypothetical protein EDB85DRAFT_2280057 [Lactarius pseudohatsudake]